MMDGGSTVPLRDLRYAFSSQVQGDKPVKVQCPLPGHEDSNPSFAVYAGGGYCFACDVYVPAKDFPTYFEMDMDALPEREPESTRQKRKPKGGYETCSPSLKLKVKLYHELLMKERKNRIPWLLKRGITRNTIESYQLGHTGDSFLIPVWYGDRLTGIRYRLDPEYVEPELLARSKYLNPKGQDTLIYRPSPGDITIITEGEFDALVLAQYGYDGVTATSGSSSLAKSLTPQTLRKEWVYVATDLDGPGNDEHRKLCERWDRHLPRLRWDRKLGKDVSEALENHPSVLKSKVIREWIEEADKRMGG